MASLIKILTLLSTFIVMAICAPAHGPSSSHQVTLTTRDAFNPYVPFRLLTMPRCEKTFANEPKNWIFDMANITSYPSNGSAANGARYLTTAQSESVVLFSLTESAGLYFVAGSDGNEKEMASWYSTAPKTGRPLQFTTATQYTNGLLGFNYQHNTLQVNEDDANWWSCSGAEGEHENAALANTIVYSQTHPREQCAPIWILGKASNQASHKKACTFSDN